MQNDVIGVYTFRDEALVKYYKKSYSFHDQSHKKQRPIFPDL